jgi:hypothetical protein
MKLGKDEVGHLSKRLKRDNATGHPCSVAVLTSNACQRPSLQATVARQGRYCCACAAVMERFERS